MTRPASLRRFPCARWGWLLALGLLGGCGRDDQNGGDAAIPTVLRSDAPEWVWSELQAGESAPAEAERALAAGGASGELEADAEAWRFLVKTASGRPAAGLELGLGLHDGVSAPELLVVDEEGRLEVALERMASVRFEAAAVADEVLTLRAEFLGAPPIEFELAGPVPSEAVEIEVPDHGSLAVQLIDAGGEPLHVAQTVRALLSAEGAAPGVAELPRAAKSKSALADSTGAARFSAVTPGHRIYLHSDATSGNGEPLLVGGPTADGERVEVRLEGRAVLPELLMTVVDEAGAPLVGRRVMARCRASLADYPITLTLWAASGITDDDGLLRLPVESSRRDVGLQWLELREQGGERPGAVVRLQNSLEGLDLFRLKTVVLRSAEAIVAGRLLNGFGAAFKDADFELVRLPEPLGPIPVSWEEYAAPTGGKPPPGFVELSNWVPDAELRADGSFEASGFPFLEGEPLALRVEPRSAPEFLHAVEAGDLDVEVRAPAGPGLMLEVVADWDELLWGSLRLTLKGSKIRFREVELTAAAPRVQLALEPDPALRVELLAGSVLVHAFDGVEIGDNGPTDLGAIDVTGRVDTFEVEVRSEAGEFLSRVSIWSETPGGQLLYVGGAMAGRDRHRCVRPREEGGWWVEAPGYRSVRLDELVADQSIVLPPGVPLELDAGISVGAAVLEARLVPLASLPGRSGRALDVQFEVQSDGDARCELLLPAAGRWNLEWHPPGANPRREDPLEVLELDVPPEGTTVRVSAPGD